MSPIENVLARLERVQQRQPGQWSARCSAHDDNGPSLSVRETPDGSVLLHCFAGCEVHEIVSAIGLELHHLFPPRERSGREPKRTPALLTATQALELLRDEAQLIAVAGANIANDVSLSADDRQRVMRAAGRVAWAVDATCRRAAT
jgi:hypothetical protein